MGFLPLLLFIGGLIVAGRYYNKSKHNRSSQENIDETFKTVGNLAGQFVHNTKHKTVLNSDGTKILKERSVNWFVVIVGLVAIFFIINKFNQKTDDHGFSNSVNTNSTNPTYHEVTYNKCSICGRQFTGNGYEEVSDGVWQLSTSDQYYICSKGCGRTHTKRMNGFVNSSSTPTTLMYHKGSNGRIYENRACSLCKGTGIETGRDLDGRVVAKICPMCSGSGVKSY